MAKPLDVDPIDLRMSAEHMDMHHGELSAAHVAANGEIEAAQVGWIGASGAALLAKFAAWQEATVTMATDIAAHGAAFQSAAEEYAATDQTSAEDIDKTL